MLHAGLGGGILVCFDFFTMLLRRLIPYAEVYFYSREDSLLTAFLGVFLSPSER